MGPTGLFACIELMFVFVGFVKVIRTGFLGAFLATAVLYLGITGMWHHGNELKKAVFLDRQYLALREEFKEAGSYVTNGGKVAAGGKLVRIVEQRKELIRRQFPFVQGDIRWEVFYDKDTLDKKALLNEDGVKVPFGWRVPPFPWQLKSWQEYPPYSGERSL